jgi:superfamily II DNA or RNA helicase
MPTGTGKSLVIALIAARFGVKTLVVVPTLEIKKQLIESLKATFMDFSFIDVHNIDSKALKTAKGYGCLIIDEGHHSAAKTYQKLNKTVWNDIYYRFFLTATPFRNDDEEKLLFESIAGQIIYRLTYKTAIAKGYIVPVEAYYIEVPKQKVEGYTWAQVYKELVVNNKVRNALISNLLITLHQSNSSTLCLVKEVQHGVTLTVNLEAPFVSGEDQESKYFLTQFNKGKINSLIATTGVCGEGIDTKPCEYVVIAGLGKAKSQFMQAVGRAVRTYPGKESAKVIIFKDTSHKWTLKHYKEQCKVLLEEYGVMPIKLDV